MQVKYLEGRGAGGPVDLAPLHAQYEDVVAGWRQRCEAAEREAAEQRAGAERGAAASREAARLQGELERTGQEGEAARLAGVGRESRAASEAQQLRDRVAVLETELQLLKVGSGGQSSGQQDRLKAELKMLRRTYEEHLRVSKEEFFSTHNQKVQKALRKINCIVFLVG